MSLNLEPKTTPDAPSVEDPIADLREQYENVRAQGTEVFPLPGWAGKLHAQYKVLDPDRKREILNAPDRTTEQCHAQLLIEACDELLFGKPDGTIIPFPNGKVTYAMHVGESRSIADVLDWHIGSVEEAVLRLFGGKPEVMNLHTLAVDRWMRTLHDQAAEALVGGPPITR